MTEPKSAAWVLRWDVHQDEKPRVLVSDAEAPAGSFVRTASGDLAVFDGYLFDRTELEPGPATGDATLVMEAYHRWGEDLFEKLRGAFTAGLWDEERRLLLVGRDAMGLNPCFYWWDGRLFLMSPSLDAILAQPGVEVRVNRVVMAEYLQNAPASHQIHETFYEGVRRLPAAHALSLSKGRLATRRYWDPVPPGFAWASAEEMSRFQDLLGRAVERCLVAGADCLALSGGFDSIGLAALAAEQSSGKPPLHALSLRFVDTTCDEGERQIAVARALGMPLLLRTIEESLEGHLLMDAVFALSSRSPSPVFSFWQPLYAGLLRSGAGLGLKGLMTGTGGDDMLCVDLTYGADCLATGDVRRLWRFYRACRGTSDYSALRVARAVFWHGAVKPEVRRLAGSTLSLIMPAGTEWIRRRRRRRAALRPWLSRRDPDLAAMLQDRRCQPLPLPMEPGERSYVRSIRYLSQAPLLQLEMEQGAWFTRSAGFSLFTPYFDRDVVELLLRIRPEHLIDGGYHKAPLRRLVGQRLPAMDTRAKKVAFGRMAHEILRSDGQRQWRALGGPRRLAELDLVEPTLVDCFMEAYFSGRSDDSLQAWLFLSAEMWLRARWGEPSAGTRGGSRNG
jgi:asparagine synthase (glutamine-hydrolysing)